MIKIAMVMDPIDGINPVKDSTFAMMLEAQRRAYDIHYITANNLFCKHGIAYAYCQKIQVIDNPKNWYKLQNIELMPLHEFNLVMMRKDPPFNMEYIMDTYIGTGTVYSNTHHKQASSFARCQ